MRDQAPPPGHIHTERSSSEPRGNGWPGWFGTSRPCGAVNAGTVGWFGGTVCPTAVRARDTGFARPTPSCATLEEIAATLLGDNMPMTMRRRP